MIYADYICNECKYLFEVSKEKMSDNFINTECPKCKSTNTRRTYGKVYTSVTAGKCGNYANGYSSIKE